MTREINDQWDAFVLRQPRAHVLQLSTWGDLKGAFGWGCERVTLTDSSDDIIAGAQVLFRPLPAKLGTMAYLPMGPYMIDPLQRTRLWYAIHETAQARSARFLKWEPGIYLDEKPPNFETLAFQPSPQTIQPPSTIMIDIRDDDDTIMARMNQGTRRKIRQGYKKGVRFYHGNREDVALFNRMIQTTGNRNEFGVHEPAYYEVAYDLFAPSGRATLIMAEHDGDPLAGIMVFAVGRFAWYLYGASSSVKRNLMATYGVQWEAIQWAKTQGCDYYDMWGIPDADEDTLEAQFKDRSDGLWGVYGFKRGWGGQVIRSAGAWDKVYNPLMYKAYELALKVRG
jgi:peptidoglycan pentaglycine glycine transferase (the first glycine)